MTEARTFKIKSPLARQMQDPGGRQVRDLERQAVAQLETHRDEAMATVVRTLDALDALCAGAAPDTGPQVYALASSIVDVAGYFDTGPLFDAAYSLCDVSDRMIQTGPWRWPPVHVHAQALRLILANGCRQGQNQRHTARRPAVDDAEPVGLPHSAVRPPITPPFRHPRGAQRTRGPSFAISTRRCVEAARLGPRIFAALRPRMTEKVESENIPRPSLQLEPTPPTSCTGL